MFHPGVFAPPPLRPYTRISGGVLPSAPGQKGQFFGPVTMTLSRRKSVGRLPRSVEMITHRPVMGSFRSSGKATSLRFAGTAYRLFYNGSDCTASRVSEEKAWKALKRAGTDLCSLRSRRGDLGTTPPSTLVSAHFKDLALDNLEVLITKGLRLTN